MEELIKFVLIVLCVAVGVVVVAYIANLLSYLITKGIMSAKADAKKEQKEKEDG